MKKIRAGIIGGAGYTAGELVRLLVNHPDAELTFIHSESNAGNSVTSVHEGLLGDTDMVFSGSFDLSSADVLFMCGAHGRSGEFWKQYSCPAELKVIDLAQDYRNESCGYVYGLPEWQREKIRKADKVANPGCFATAIQLALLPLAKAGLLSSEINVNAITGSTGAGVKPGPTSHFSWRNNNISIYKVFEHQHLAEICRNLSLLSGKEVPAINFIPVRGDFARGIFATVHTDCPLTEVEAVELYRDFYRDVPFTFVSDAPIDLKSVVNTNKCVIFVEKHGNKLVISSAVDNLLKGASGQAVENMNLMCGLDPRAGLRLKASAF